MAHSRKQTDGKVSSSDQEQTQDQIVADGIMRDIVEWRIPPGTWLRERAIAERFGVSHAPVREALRQLTSIGLVQVVPWRGVQVIEVDRHKTVEVLELWKSIFGVVCRLACENMTAEDDKELMRRFRAYKQDIKKQETSSIELLVAGNKIGTLIAERCGGLLAKELLDRVAILARWQHHVISREYMRNQSPEVLHRFADLYEMLCRHVIARQPDMADRAARDLLGYLQEVFEPAVEEYLSKSDAANPLDNI